MRPTVHLHVGYGRCGSSSIQMFGRERRAELSERGVLYPSPTEMGFSEDDARGGNGRAIAVSEDLEAAVNRYVSHIAAAAAPRVLLSAEQFVDDDGRPLEALVSALRVAGLRVVGIFYLREQREWLISRWAQGLKSQRWTIPLDDFIAAHVAEPSPGLDYRNITQRLTAIFGREDLVLRRFSRAALEGGDVRLDLFGLLGVDVTDLVADAPTANASAAIEEAVALRILNTLPRSRIAKPRPFLRYAEDHAAREGRPRDRLLYRLVAPERLRAVAEYYAPRNEELRLAAFPADTPAPLLPSEIPDDYDQIGEDDVVTTHSVALVSGFLAWYGGLLVKQRAARSGPGRPAGGAAPGPTATDLRERYLASLRRELMGRSDRYPYRLVKRPRKETERRLYDAVRAQGMDLVTLEPPGHDLYGEGGGWPVTGMTMIGERRLEQVQRAVETILAENVPGDLIETGVWRGGSCILMRAVLQAHGDTSRRVWVADSFAGVPPPDADAYPQDAGDGLHGQPALAIGLEEVQANFASYDLLDDQVRFLPGWFRDTLPTLRDERWSIVRLDGDLYESTIIGLEELYPRLAPGGFLIVDDWGAMSQCREAAEDYRREHGIAAPIHQIDWTGVFWRKEA